MIPLPKLTAHDRVLILAPHPDDEALATGGLIQRAIAVRAKVRVLFATDGENNPWPQRVVERKWSIQPEDRARWGARRRREALLSLAHLGVPANAVRFFGLPDQGITGMLLTGDDRPLRLLGDALREWQPTWIVFPASADVHPDHSALHVFMKFAIDRVRLETGTFAELHFIVHAPKHLPRAPRVELALCPEEKARKREAILCHASQMALSRGRFVAYAKDVERYWHPEKNIGLAHHHPIRRAGIENGALRMELHLGKVSLKGAQLCVAAESMETGSVRWLLPMPTTSRRVHLRDADTGALLRLATVRIRGRHAEIHIPVAALLPVDQLFVKLERRFLFFDEAGWREVPASHSVHPAKQGVAQSEK